MWLSTREGGRTFFNKTWLEFTGRPLAAELGIGWVANIHDEDRARAIAAYHDGVRLGHRFELEYRLRRVDGVFRHVLDRAAPRLADGGVAGFVGSCLDITERTAAELALRQREQLFRLLAENARDVIYRYRIHPTFRCEYISAAATALYGRRPEEFLADPDLGPTLLHPDDRSIGLAMRTEPEDFTEPIILRWMHNDGRVVSVEHRNTPVFENGRLIAIEGIGRDVTDRVAIEARLRESERQLRLLAANVEQAREDERALIARELHDELGQSLTAIKFELARAFGALNKRAVSPAALDGLQSVIGGVDVATETVRRLATSLRPPALDYLGLVEAIELEATALGRRTGIRCRITGNRRLVPLTAIQMTGLFRIVQEALTNVARHASASAITISIQGTSTTTSVTVRDNGRGMVWDKAPSQSAIGLIGMHERAEAIGGQLTIQSTLGKGTSVRIVLGGEPRRARRRKK